MASALRVTPVPPPYPAYRAAVTAALTTISVASRALTGQVDPATLVLCIPVAVVAALLAPSLGRTKIEGLAVMRVDGLAVFTLPVIPFFFLDQPGQPASGVLPPHWGWAARMVAGSMRDHETSGVIDGRRCRAAALADRAAVPSRSRASIRATCANSTPFE